MADTFFSQTQITQIDRSETTMTTLHELAKKQNSTTTKAGAERRQHRRHDMEQQGLPIDRWDGSRRTGKIFGHIVDLSAGGVRIRTKQADIRPDHQIRVRLELPEYAGISPFIDNRSNDGLKPKREWAGWMAVKHLTSPRPMNRSPRRRRPIG